MFILWLTLFIKGITSNYVVTPYLAHIDSLPNVAKHQNAEHRGPNWHDDDSSTSSSLEETDSDTDTSSMSASSSTSDSSSASSFETKERKMATRVYRVCTPCPNDMMRAHKNRGISWICGGYQRARRTFKSECMMRYRNCEDGTIDEQKCRRHNNCSEQSCMARKGGGFCSAVGRYWADDDDDDDNNSVEVAAVLESRPTRSAIYRTGLTLPGG